MLLSACKLLIWKKALDGATLKSPLFLCQSTEITLLAFICRTEMPKVFLTLRGVNKGAFRVRHPLLIAQGPLRKHSPDWNRRCVLSATGNEWCPSTWVKVSPERDKTNPGVYIISLALARVWNRWKISHQAKSSPPPTHAYARLHSSSAASASAEDSFPNSLRLQDGATDVKAAVSETCCLHKKKIHDGPGRKLLRGEGPWISASRKNKKGASCARADKRPHSCFFVRG